VFVCSKHFNIENADETNLRLKGCPYHRAKGAKCQGEPLCVRLIKVLMSVGENTLAYSAGVTKKKEKGFAQVRFMMAREVAPKLVHSEYSYLTHKLKTLAKISTCLF
jgi:hypothetical protein